MERLQVKVIKMNRKGMEVSVLGKIILGLIVLFIILGIMVFMTQGGTNVIDEIINVFRFS